MDLLVFTPDAARAAAVVEAGAAGVILDWERRGKARRQQGQDTQINEDTAADLAAVRSAVPATGRGRVLCRVNGAGPWTAHEVQVAVELGADEVLLPMVRTAADVDLALDAVAGRCGLGVLVETQAAVDVVREAGARDQAVDGVPLTERIVEPLQDEQARPLADDQAVRSASSDLVECIPDARAVQAAAAAVTVGHDVCELPIAQFAGAADRHRLVIRCTARPVVDRDVADESPLRATVWGVMVPGTVASQRAGVA